MNVISIVNISTSDIRNQFLLNNFFQKTTKLTYICCKFETFCLIWLIICLTHNFLSLSIENQNIIEITKHWNNFIIDCINISLLWNNFFYKSNMLSRDEKCCDYIDVLFQQILFDQFLSSFLNLIKSETKFLHNNPILTQITLRYIFDINNFQVIIINLNVFKHFFKLVFRSFFF